MKMVLASWRGRYHRLSYICGVGRLAEKSNEVERNAKVWL